MTIFLEAVKFFLVKEIKHIRDHSITKDATKPLRGKTLSEIKHDLADELKGKIKNLNSSNLGKASSAVFIDDAYLSLIKTIIEKYQTLAAIESRNHGEQPDNFDVGMRNLLYLSERFLTILKNSELDSQEIAEELTKDQMPTPINVKLGAKLGGSIGIFIGRPYDNDPYNILCYHAAFYLGEELFRPQQETMPEKAARIARLSTGSKAQTRGDKEAALLEKIKNCRSILVDLDGQRNTSNSRKAVVLQTINEINIKNNEICNNGSTFNGVNLGIPSLKFFGATVKALRLRPGLGRLKTCMDSATDEIQNPKPGKTKNDIAPTSKPTESTAPEPTESTTPQPTKGNASSQRTWSFGTAAPLPPVQKDDVDEDKDLYEEENDNNPSATQLAM